jgi:hypothetical protein
VGLVFKEILLKVLLDHHLPLFLIDVLEGVDFSDLFEDLELRIFVKTINGLTIVYY